MILEHWKLNQNFINILNGDNKPIFKILGIVNTVFNIIKPLDSAYINNAIKQAESMNIDITNLKKQIEKIKENFNKS